MLAHSLPFIFPLTGEAFISSVGVMQKANSSSLRNTSIVIMCVCVLTCWQSLCCGICNCCGFHIFDQLCLVKWFYFITQRLILSLAKANAISNKDKFSPLCQYLCVRGSKWVSALLSVLVCDEVCERLTERVWEKEQTERQKHMYCVFVSEPMNEIYGPK